MSMICQVHNVEARLICGKGQCKYLFCIECFTIHARQTGHLQAAILSVKSIQFFIEWSNIVIVALVDWLDRVSQKGYGKVIQLRLLPNYPKGTLSQISQAEINLIATTILQDYKELTLSNLRYVQSNTHFESLNHPDFLRDLYNLIIENTKFNLNVIMENLKSKLAATYPHKEIYKFTGFMIVPRQVQELEDRRKDILRVCNDQLIYALKEDPKVFKRKSLKNIEDTTESPTKIKAVKIESPTQSKVVSSPRISRKPIKTLGDYVEQIVSIQNIQTINSHAKIQESNGSKSAIDQSTNEKLVDNKIKQQKPAEKLNKNQIQLQNQRKPSELPPKDATSQFQQLLHKYDINKDEPQQLQPAIILPRLPSEKELCEEIDYLKLSNGELAKEVANNYETEIELKNRIGKLQAKLKQYEEIGLTPNEIAKHIQRENELEEQLSKYTGIVELLQKKITICEDQLVQYEDQNLNNVSQSNQVIDHLRAELKIVHSQSYSKELALTDLKIQRDTWIRAAQTKDKELEQIKLKVKEYEQSVPKINENAKIKQQTAKQINELKTQRERIIQQKDKQIFHLKDFISRLKQQNVALKSESASKKQQNDQLKQQTDQLKLQLSQISAQLSTQQSKIEKELILKNKALEADKSALQAEIFKLQSQLNFKENPDDVLLAETIELEADLQAKIRDIDILVSFVNDIGAEYNVPKEIIRKRLIQLTTVQIF